MMTSLSKLAAILLLVAGVAYADEFHTHLWIQMSSHIVTSWHGNDVLQCTWECSMGNYPHTTQTQGMSENFCPTP